MMEIMDQFIQNNFNFDESSKARRSVILLRCLAVDNCLPDEIGKANGVRMSSSQKTKNAK